MRLFGVDGARKVFSEFCTQEPVFFAPVWYYLTGASKTRQSPRIIWPQIRPGNHNKDDLISLTTRAD